jgi:DNA repair ATPase RecN
VTRSVRMTALGALAALALAGCGGGDGGPVGPQKEHIAKADPICEQAQNQVGTLGDDAAKDRDVVRSAAERLGALNAPSEDETIWMQFIRESDNLWLALEDVAQARDPSTNDKARADKGLTRVRETNTRAAGLAKKYGMKICSDGFGRNP